MENKKWLENWRVIDLLELVKEIGGENYQKHKYKYLQPGAQKVLVFRRDPREQGTPPDLPNAHASMQQLSFGHM